MVNFHVDDMPWEEALTRLLRQVKLGWRQEDDNSNQIVIYELDSDAYQPEPAQTQQEAIAALRAAAKGSDDVIAAQARFLLAQFDAKRAETMRKASDGSDDSSWRALHYNAIAAYADIIQDFDTGSRGKAESLPWVRRSMLGIGTSMEAVGMYREAYGVYRNYYAKADRSDPQRPRVMLAAAYAARQQHRRSALDGDTSDLEIASTLLRDLITDYGSDPRMLALVSGGSPRIGALYFQQGSIRRLKIIDDPCSRSWGSTFAPDSFYDRPERHGTWKAFTRWQRNRQALAKFT